VTTKKRRRRLPTSGRMTSVDHRLVARYCPVARDLYVDLTPRFGSSDLRFLLSVLSEDVLNQFAERGYDLATLRFSVDKTDEAKLEHERWVTVGGKS
jgi:hypothetical protein